MSATEPTPTPRSPSPSDAGPSPAAARPLPVGSPEEQGVPSDAVLAMVRRWEREGLEPHGVLVVRHGVAVAQGSWAPYRPDGIQLVYSVSKTFLACAVGLAEAEGLISRQDRLVDLFPEAAAAAGPRASRITVEDCLRMSTGHRADTLETAGLAGLGDEAAARFLATEPDEEPGSWFLYHNGASRVLALAVQRRTGQRLVDYLRPRLLDPLGVGDCAWSTWGGTNLGHSGFHVTTQAVARLGLLFLDDGVWEGRRLLPPGWVAMASANLADTSHHSDPADWTVGYGYQMWRSRHGYRADGAFGQFALVLPEHDLVVALTACTEQTQALLDAVWKELLPRLEDAPLPQDPAAHDRLTAALDAAALPATATTAPPPRDAGPWRFRHEPTPEHRRLTAVEVRRADDGWALRVDDGEPLDVPCGDGRWPQAQGSPFVATGGWVEPGVFEATVVALETPHSLHLRCGPGGVTARWRAQPLHGSHVGALRAPAH